ncbi:MAG: hypothetical protein K0R65_329 [Crocinitomicaceae bacterium]|jgi:outer membrane protein W|nr:hypothetical protein [Crocinitomicaceae bacterium]
MKKLFILGLVAVGSALSSNVNAQAVEEGNVIVDVYYGFPNLYTTVLKAAYTNSGSNENVKIGGIGPLGLRGEYMVADKIGVGIDIGFNNSSISYDYEDTEYNSATDTYVVTTQTDKISTQKLGVLATFNYHFIENDKVDAYAVFGAGYGKRSFKYESTDPDFEEAKVSGLIPVASKIGVGMRYFFTDNIGANLALGFGQGGIINVGISAKF